MGAFSLTEMPFATCLQCGVPAVLAIPPQRHPPWAASSAACPNLFHIVRIVDRTIGITAHIHMSQFTVRGRSPFPYICNFGVGEPRKKMVGALIHRHGRGFGRRPSTLAITVNGALGATHPPADNPTRPAHGCSNWEVAPPILGPVPGCCEAALLIHSPAGNCPAGGKSSTAKTPVTSSSRAILSPSSCTFSATPAGRSGGRCHSHRAQIPSRWIERVTGQARTLSFWGSGATKGG